MTGKVFDFGLWTKVDNKKEEDEQKCCSSAAADWANIIHFIFMNRYMKHGVTVWGSHCEALIKDVRRNINRGHSIGHMYMWPLQKTSSRQFLHQMIKLGLIKMSSLSARGFISRANTMRVRNLWQAHTKLRSHRTSFFFFLSTPSTH